MQCYTKNFSPLSKDYIYQNYHKHSIYTNVIMLDSVAYPEDYAKKAKELGHGIISSCEHGYQGRYIESFQMAEKYDLKFLFAVESYFVKNRFEKDKTNAHIILAAKNENGRKAINKILSEANETGFYYRARIDFPLLFTLPKDDVWITSACIGGINKYSDYEEIIKQIHNYFGDNFYLEVQAHNVQSQKDWNAEILRLSKKYNIEIIAGVDSHYINPEDAWMREYLQKSGHIFLEEEEGFYMDYPSGETLYKRFQEQGVLDNDDIQIAMNNTNVFLNVEYYDSPIFNHEVKMPSAPKYANLSKIEKDKALMRIVYENWQKEKQSIPKDKWKTYEQEIVKELKTIFEINHSDYFLLNYEIIKNAVDNKGGMITYSGRGCECAGALIHTVKTLKTIEDVRIGDKVLSDDGKFHSVIKTYKYDIEEPLVQIIHDYGTRKYNPTIFTEDHKILIHRNNKNQWIEAKNILLNDYVCCPKIKTKSYPNIIIDLNKFNSFGYKYDDEWIYEYNSNYGKSYKYSPTDVANHIGCGASIIEKVANGNYNTFGKRKPFLIKKFFEYVPFSSFEEYHNYIKEKRTSKIRRYIELDEEFNTFIGLLYGDGTNRKKESVISLAINSTTKKDKINKQIFLNIIKRIGKNKYYIGKSKHRKLEQLLFTSKIFSKFIGETFFYSKIGKEKIFNEILFNQSKVNLKALKYGLWLADGSDSDDRISFDNTSLSLINAYKILSLMVEDCGICSIIKRIGIKDNRGYQCKDSYKLRYPTNPFNKKRSKRIILQDENFWYLPIKEIKFLPKQKTSVYDITVEDTHNYLNNNMIVHNSGPSFYVNHLLGFTAIDRISCPITLYPERFLSASRIKAGSLADIDFNCGNVSVFAESQREILGENHAYPMITFGLLKAKSAWKMYCRANSVDFDIANQISTELDKYEKDLKYYDPESGDSEPQVLDYIPDHLQELFLKSKKFLGLVDHGGVHACGYLLASFDIREEVGIMRLKSKGGKETMVTVADGKWVEKYLMLKNDLLSVTCVKLVYLLYERCKIKPMSLTELMKACKENPEVWKIYENGYTLGVNQLEKNSSKHKAMKYKPHNISELSALIAGIRPAFKSLIDKLINREDFSYNLPTFDKLLQTEELPQSFILYQEQIMKVLAFAGIPMDDCYTVIKSISKKRVAVIESYKTIFLKGFSKAIQEQENKGKEESDQLAVQIWGIIQDASAYGFNSSHSLSVSFDSLLAAYFKALYPLEFYEVYLNVQMDRADKAKALLAKEEARKAFGITILPMRFGQDNRKFTAYPEKNALSNCLKSIKGFGTIVGDELYKISKNTYDNFLDLLVDMKNLKINKTQIETLIKLNYFEKFGKNKKLLYILELFHNYIGKSQINKKIVNENPNQWNLEILKKYLIKECNSIYKVDFDKYIKEISEKIEDKSLSLREQLEFERKLLEIPIYINKIIPSTWYYVLGFKVYNNKKNLPYLILYQLQTGNMIKCSINKGKLYDSNPFYDGSILNILNFADVSKRKQTSDGKWQITNELKTVIKEYEVLDNYNRNVNISENQKNS